MANATDTRIVQMMFDNKQFERGIKVSENSLEKFKKMLDFSKCEKGLDGLSSAVENLGFQKAADNLQKLTDKFTGLGTVSELVLSQIRRGIESTARSISGLINSLTFDQIGAGKTKFEELNKNVKTIMGATGRSEEEVMNVMQRLNAYTDQTSYNFTDMAANIGKFTSAGIKLEDAEKEMEGIANWAARSGAGIQEASRAMYNLSQAIGMGKLTVMDWKSIENANMATKEFKEQLIQAGLAAKTLVIDDKGNIKTAKSLGKQIEVNYKNLRSTLQKGWATNQVLEKALLGYYYEDLYYENQKVIQLTQEMLKKNEELFKDNRLDVKEWGTLVQNGIINKDVQKTILDIAAEQKNLVKETDKNGKDIYYVLDKNNKKIQVTMDNIAETLQYGWLDKNIAMRLGLIEDLGEESYKAAQKCTTLTDVFNAWKDQLSTGWMRFWQKIFGGMTESMELFSTICNKVGDSFSNFIRVLVGDGEKIEGIFGAWEILGGRDSLWSMFVGEYDGMYEGAYGFLDVLQDIGQMISHGFWSMVKLINPDLASVSDEEWFANETYRTQEFAFMLKDAIDKVKNFIQGIKDFMTEVPAGAKKSRFEQVQDVVNGVMSIAVIAYNTIKDIVGFVETLLDQNHLGPAVDSIIEIFSMLGTELSKVAGETSKGQGLGYFLNNLLSILGNKDEGLIHSINEFIGFIKDLIGSLLGVNSEESRTIKLWQLLADFWTRKLKRVALVLNHIILPIIGFFKDLLVAGKQLATGEIDFTGFVERVKAAIKKAIDSIFSFTPNFTGKVKQIFQDIKDIFNTGFSKESIDKLSGHIGEMFTDLKKKIPQSVKTALTTIYNGIKGFLVSAYTKIKEFFKPFFSDVKNVFTSGFSKASIKQLKERFKIIFQSISDAIPQGIKDGFKSVLKKVENKITEIWNKIKEKITGAISKKDGSSETAETVGRYFRAIFNPKEFGMGGNKNIFERIVDWVKAGFNSVKDFIVNLFGGAKASKPVEKVKEFANQVLNPSGFEQKDNNSIFSQVGEMLSNGIAKVRSVLFKLIGVTEEDNMTLYDAIKQLDLSRIAMLLVGALGVIGLYKVIKKVAKSVELLLGIGKNISDIPKNLANALRGYPVSETAGDKWLKMAIAIGVIVYALIQVGKMDFWSALGGIVVIGLIVGGLLWAMGRMKELFSDMTPEQLDAFRSGIRGILILAISILLVSKAMVKIGKLDWQEWIRAIVGFGGIIGAFYAVSEILKGGNSFKWKNMSGLIAFALSMIVMAFALKVLATIPLLKLVKALGAVAGILFLLYEFVSFVNQIPGVSMANSGMKELGFLALAVAILAFSLVPLALLPTANLIQALAGVGILLFMLYEFVKKINENKATMRRTAMAQLIAVVGAVLLLVIAIIPLSMIPVPNLVRALLAVGILMFMLYEFIAKLNENKATMSKTGMAQLLAVVLAVQMLVIAMIPLMLMDFWKMVQGLAGVGVLLLLLAGFVKIINENSATTMKGTGMVQLLAVALAVQMLVIALVPLSMMNPEQLWPAIGAVAVLLGLLVGVAVLMSNFAKEVKPSAMIAFLGVAGAVLILVLALIPLTMVPIDRLWAAVGSIFVLMLGMFAIVMALSNMDSDMAQAVKGALMLLVLAGVIYVFSVALNKVKNVKASVILAFGVALTALLLGMAGAIKILSTIQNPAAMFAAMIAIVGGIALLMAAVAVMVPIIMNAIASGLENMMAKLAIVAGMFSNFVSSMESFSEESLNRIKRKFEILYNMIVSIKDVGSYLQSVDRFATCVERLGSAMSLYTTLTQGLEDPENSTAIKFMNTLLEKKDAIAGFSVGTFATAMQDLGSGIAAFTDNASSVTDDEPTSWKLLKRFLDNSDAIIALGSTDFSVTTKGIQGLGGALSIFAKGADEAGNITGGVDQAKVNSALEIMEAITTGINEKGGFTIPNIPKEDEIGTFPSDLAALAMALSEFSTACKDFDKGNTGAALDALGFLGELNTNLTSDKLAVANVFTEAGVQPGVMSQFALDIRSLGAALHSYWLRTKDIGDTSNSEKSLTYFKNLSSDLTKELIQKTKVFDGTGVDNTTLGQFALDITALGGALADFANNTHFNSGVKQTFDSAIEALQGLVDLSNKMPLVGGVKQFIEGYNRDLGSLSEDLEKLGPGMADFAKAVTETFDFSDEKVVSAMHNGLTIINDLVTILSQMGKLGEAFKWGTSEDLQYYTTYYASMIRLFMQTLTQEIPDLEDQFGNTVSPLGTNLVKLLKDFDTALDIKGGLKNGNAAEIMRSLSEALYNLAQAAATLDGAEGEVSFNSVGLNIAKGVAAGILSKDADNAVCDAAKEMIQRIYDAANKAADSRSPSRLFRDRVGRYLALGVAVGITRNAKTAAESAKTMIGQVIESARETAQVKSPSRVFMELGEYLGAGLTIGIENSNNSVVKASTIMANSSINAMKEALGIHSPSTEAAELGGYIIDGYRQGIEKEEKNLHTMLEGVGEDSLDAMQEGWQSAAKNDPLFSLKAAQFKLDTEHDETVKNGVQTYLNDLSRAGEQEVKKQVLRRNYFSNFWHTLQTAFYVGIHDGRLPDKTRSNGLTMEEWDDFNNNILAPVLAGLAFGTVGADYAVKKTVETQAQNFNLRIIRWAWGAYQDVKKGINEAIPGIIQGYGQFVGNAFGKSNETAVDGIVENLVPSAKAESDAKAKIKEEAPNFFVNLAKFAGSFMRNNFKGSENSDLDFWGNLVSSGLMPSAKAESDAETKISEEAPNFVASLTQLAGDFIRDNFKGSENSDLDFWGNLIAGIIKPSSNTVTDTEQTVAQTANDFFSGLTKEFIGVFSHGSVSPLGGLLIDSVIGGMNNEERAILNTMEAIMLGTTAKAFDTVEAHSPSEIFTQLGEFMMIGLGNGIESKSGEVEAKVQRVMDHLINLTGGPLSNLNALLESEIDTSPTITPVLNLSGVETGIQAMNGMIGNAPFGLALNGGMLSIDPSSATLLASSFMPKDYTAPIQGIQNEVGELRSDIKTLSESMRQMKFVFNSGQVVAAIGPEMDAYLGQQGYYAVRGEIP